MKKLSKGAKTYLGVASLFTIGLWARVLRKRRPPRSGVVSDPPLPPEVPSVKLRLAMGSRNGQPVGQFQDPQGVTLNDQKNIAFVEAKPFPMRVFLSAPTAFNPLTNVETQYGTTLIAGIPGDDLDLVFEVTETAPAPDDQGAYDPLQFSIKFQYSFVRDGIPVTGDAYVYVIQAP
jgi:hypothetical protein